MAKENKQSSMSVNLHLTESLIEKIIVILLSSLVSFSSGIVYSNYQNSNLPVNRHIRDMSNTVK